MESMNSFNKNQNRKNPPKNESLKLKLERAMFKSKFIPLNWGYNCGNFNWRK